MTGMPVCEWSRFLRLLNSRSNALKSLRTPERALQDTIIMVAGGSVTPTIIRVEEETTVIPLVIGEEVIGEDLFKAAVIRERKRTGRSGLAIALLMIGLKTQKGTDSSLIWNDITQA